MQVAAVVYCVLLLRRHRIAATAWACLLGTMLSMLTWRVVVTIGVTPGPGFNTVVAIWGSVCAVLAMYFFARAVERRERAELERDQLLASERAARSEAERANRIKDEFMATLSHELRSPLAAILGWCAILRKADTGTDPRRAVDTIERNARVQTRLVDDLLDATRMQTGSLPLDTAPVSLDACVVAALEAVRPAADAKPVTLRYDAPASALVVMGDASRLQQIASNLLVNAVKFTPEGRSVQVTLRPVNGYAELVVADEGIGIDRDFMASLFQRFRQADTGNARRHGGLGLGLAIVSTLVTLHKGDVHATSDGPGTGATFTVRLPLATGPFAQTDVRRDVAPPGVDHDLDGVRVIVVDDEEDLRGAVSALLEQAGATVLALESGATIDTAIAEFRPDVLVLDIGMPGEDGYSLIRRVRRLPPSQGGTIPALSLTAHALDEDRRHAIDSGFQDHLPKPVNLPLLVSSIRTLVAARHTVSQTAGA